MCDAELAYPLDERQADNQFESYQLCQRLMMSKMSLDGHVEFDDSHDREGDGSVLGN